MLNAAPKHAIRKPLIRETAKKYVYIKDDVLKRPENFTFIFVYDIFKHTFFDTHLVVLSQNNNSPSNRSKQWSYDIVCC